MLLQLNFRSFQRSVSKKALLLTGALLCLGLVPADSAPSSGRRVVLRSIQVVQNGKLLPLSAYKLTTWVSYTNSHSEEVPLVAGPTIVSYDTHWTLRQGAGEYTLWQVEEYLASARTYDVRLELRSSEHPLTCLDLSYRDKQGQDVETHTTSISAGHEEKAEWHPTCDMLFLIPVQGKSKR
jgi:hypothetical protein